VGHHLEAFAADELLLELLRRQRIDWDDLLMAGGVDPVEAESRGLVELLVDRGLIVILTSD
jgi:hypothetical protein